MWAVFGNSFFIDGGDLCRGVSKCTATECTQHNVAHSMVFEGFKLCFDFSPARGLVERVRSFLAQVIRCRAQLKKREDFVGPEPAVARSFAATNAHSWPVDVEVHTPMLSVDQVCHLLLVPFIGSKLLAIDEKMAAGTPKHVFFLGSHAFNITSTRQLSVGHVEGCVHNAIFLGHLLNNVSPISTANLDLWCNFISWRRFCPGGNIGGC
mmetsp:Transcript_17797/g.34761  ORF Transcript_17797/g.34761 Transcript_17797/m.34761 type:complete len:209 (+) Transcript_17797:663-1289(+)